MLQWQLWIDTGGTFTDCLALDPSGHLKRAKVLSNSALRGVITHQSAATTFSVQVSWQAPADFIAGFTFHLLDQPHSPLQVKRYVPHTGLITLDNPLPSIPTGTAFEVRTTAEAPILAAHLVTGTAMSHSLPPLAMRLATTRGTNALLERRGIPTALFITAGFGDLLDIGTQARPELFALEIIKPAPLYTAVVEIKERLQANGRILRALDLEGLEQTAKNLIKQGIRSAAVALLHAYHDPTHEQAVVGVLRRCGFEYIAAAATLSPFIKIVPRAVTAVVDAYIGPVIDTYLNGVQQALNTDELHIMTSAGGLLKRASYRAKDSLLSGPAGGVTGAATAGHQAGYDHIISFDMGGTSTDVARYAGDYEYLFEHYVGDAHLVAPALAIETVAAGGGSICRFVDGRLHVGPQSAGAHPGPACYGAGGPLTLTDVNLLLGRLRDDHFGIPILPHKAQERLDQVQHTLADFYNQQTPDQDLLEGFVQIANERMADAIRRISLQRGYDPAAYALVAFGGAGAQHACGVAEALNMDTVLVPADAGLLSAQGLGHALVERFAERQVLAPLNQVSDQLTTWIACLETTARTLVAAEGIDPADIVIRRRLAKLRFSGQDTSLSVEYNDIDSLEVLFAQHYLALYGHRPEARPIEVESLHVIACCKATIPSVEATLPPALAIPLTTTTRLWTQGTWHEVPLVQRHQLQPGHQLVGPALILEAHSTTFIAPDWTLKVVPSKALVLHHSTPDKQSSTQQQPEAVQLELFTHSLSTVATEMGTLLQRTALSTNVKERLDFSCAILDPQGRLVVNAPHIPVHLGALGVCVRAVRQSLALDPGDVVITNHPKFGGSHLPDITVISPVFDHNRRLLAYVANRAHHAELGGMRPGSMPPDASCLAQEGIVIPPTYLARADQVDWETIRHLLLQDPYPTRSIEENIADLRAALAANHRGREALLKLGRTYGNATFKRFMDTLRHQSNAGIRTALKAWPDGVYQATEKLDDNARLQVRITILGDQATIDFSGSSGVHPGNLNATPAIVRSALIYVLRLCLNTDLPLNEGLMEAIELIIPPGMLNPDFPDDPASAPAVVGGNVETSQRLVDTLLKALNLVAASQGTMNNLLFGTSSFGYYETICGGSGAGPNFHGTDAVHTHMTNTRITDPEILEHRYPVRLERFSIRPQSGGSGAYTGGNGVIRELVFLEPMSLSLLSQRRQQGPYGLAGGSAGKPGTQLLIRQSGLVTPLKAIDAQDVEAGDRLILETPGGGGYGQPT